MFAEHLRNALVGTLMGAVSQLPGASGSTIAVIFRIYERLVSDVADIRGKLLKDLRFIVVVGLGFVLGYWICARTLDAFIDEHYIPLLFLFGALIIVQIPEIKGFADDGNRYTVSNIISFVAGVAVMVAIYFVKTQYAPGDVDTGALTMIVAGLVVAASFISPGISGSTILLVMGIYPAFIEAISHFDFKLLLPLCLGIIVGLIIFAKVIDHFMRVSRKSTYCAILGLTAGSAVIVFAEAVTGTTGDNALESFICLILGAVLGYVMLRAARIYSEKN